MTLLIKWFPPSWFQIKVDNIVIYIDPAYLRTYFLSYPKHIEYSKWPDEIDGLPEELEKADIILITHHHKDHFKLATIKRLQKTTTLIVAPKLCAKEIDSKIKVIEENEIFKIDSVEIKSVPAYNTKEGNSTNKVHHKGKGVGYILKYQSKSIYHSGDTDFIPEMKMFGNIDLAMLPIGGTYTMDIADAIKATTAIKPRYVVPMHFLKADPNKFKRLLESKTKVIVKLLEIGGSFQL